MALLPTVFSFAITMRDIIQAMKNHPLRAEIAVIVPCYNEEAAIAKVVRDFRKSLPSSEIHVFDNNSKDRTVELANQAGAIVHSVKFQGKGNVVRRMFADVDADVYIMVDGDATYDAGSAPKLVKKLVDEKLDMVVGCRIEESTENKNYRAGHRMGNKMLTSTVQHIFGGQFTDMLSGYRAFSRRYAKSFPAQSRGFETETELTVHALELRMPYGEVNTPYSERPEGSESKLSTYKDGWRILMMIIRLYASERPMAFFGLFGSLFLLVALALFIPISLTFLETGTVPKLPTVVLVAALGISGLLSLSVGLILNTVTIGRREAKHLAYLVIEK